MICVQNFTKKYGDREVVKNISFTAKDGAITGFIGHNGVGKSTTIKAITGVIRPTEGTIMINGIDVVKEALSINTYIRIEKGPGYPGLQLSPAGLITES